MPPNAGKFVVPLAMLASTVAAIAGPASQPQRTETREELAIAESQWLATRSDPKQHPSIPTFHFVNSPREPAALPASLWSPNDPTTGTIGDDEIELFDALTADQPLVLWIEPTSGRGGLRGDAVALELADGSRIPAAAVPAANPAYAGGITLAGVACALAVKRRRRVVQVTP